MKIEKTKLHCVVAYGSEGGSELIVKTSLRECIDEAYGQYLADYCQLEEEGEMGSVELECTEFQMQLFESEEHCVQIVGAESSVIYEYYEKELESTSDTGSPENPGESIRVYKGSKETEDGVTIAFIIDDPISPKYRTDEEIENALKECLGYEDLRDEEDYENEDEREEAVGLMDEGYSGKCSNSGVGAYFTYDGFCDPLIPGTIIQRIRASAAQMPYQIEPATMGKIAVETPLGRLEACIGGNPEDYPEIFTYLVRPDGVEIDLVACEVKIEEDIAQAYLYGDTSTYDWTKREVFTDDNSECDVPDYEETNMPYEVKPVYECPSKTEIHVVSEANEYIDYSFVVSVCHKDEAVATLGKTFDAWVEENSWPEQSDWESLFNALDQALVKAGIPATAGVNAIEATSEDMSEPLSEMNVLEMVDHFMAQGMTEEQASELANSEWQARQSCDAPAHEKPELIQTGHEMGYPSVQEMIELLSKLPKDYKVSCCGMDLWANIIHEDKIVVIDSEEIK